MKQLKLLGLGLFVLAITLQISCARKAATDVGSSVGNNTFRDVFTLQGTVFDATTGARLGSDKSFHIYLVQGSDTRTPSKLVTKSTDVLLGEYAFNGIPVTLDGDNTTYKLVVVQDGYQQFEALVSMTAENNFNSNNNTIDTDYNMIGNVYLFPIGSTASDLKVHVEYNGKPLEGATVELQQNAANNSATTEVSSSYRLSAYSGMLPTLSGTTDSKGVVTFAGTDLVLGGRYTPIVLPTTFEGTQLARTSGSAVTVGVSNLVTTVAVDDTNPGTQTEGLYVAFASNSDPDAITGVGSGVGKLTLVFNKAVSLAGDSDGYGATVVVPDPGSPGNFTAPPTAVLKSGKSAVTADLSSDGLTLTLTPNFSTDPEADQTNEADYDAGLTVTYTGISVKVKNGNGDETALTALKDYSDTLISLTVNILN